MSKPKDYPSNVFPITKTVKIPVYSNPRYEDGEITGDLEGYIDTPIEWLQEDKKIH